MQFLQMQHVRFTVLVFILIITPHKLPAQSGEDQSESANNSLQDGAWSLQFQINSNFTLSSFQGTILSIKRNFSEHDAIRAGLSLSLASTESDQGGSSYQADTLYSGQAGDRSQSSNGGSLSAQYLYYPNPQALINFFFGGGPIVQVSRSQVEDFQGTQYASGGSIQTQSLTSDSKTWGVGGSVLVGAEWFATHALSLHAEYGLSGVYVSSTSTSVLRSHNEYIGAPSRDVVSNSNSDQNGWQFNGTSVRLGLSLYF